MIQSLLAQSRDCIKLIDLEGRLIYMSVNGLAAMEIEDFSTVSNKAWRDLWPEPSQVRIDEAIAAARNGEASRFQAYCPTGAGDDRWWDVSVSPLHDDQGQVSRILSISRDISFQYTDLGREDALRTLVKQLQQEKALLARARAEISHLEKVRLLGQFAGGIVHDLNNILATMSSASSLLRRRIDMPVAEEILNHVDQAVLRGAELTRQLLDFSRIDNGGAEIVDVRAVLQTDHGMLRHLVGSDIELTLELDGDASPVLLPSSRLRSVLFNLLANSRDAMDGCGNIVARVYNRTIYGRVRDLSGGRYTVIEIEDDGCGMSPEVIAQLGNAFFTTKASGKGTGLGIPSAFELAKMCGGEVRIDSVVGQGTKIRIILAASPVKSNLMDAIGERIDPAQHGNATIMVIENDMLMRNHLVSSLQSLGYTVLEAASASSAIATALTVAKVDLLISDLFLDKSVGHEAVAGIRAHAPGLPVIFLSGTAGMGIPVGEVLLRKPVDEAILAKVILEQLGRLPARLLTQKLIAQSERLKGKLKQPAMVAAYDAWRSACIERHRLPSRNALAALEPLLATTSYIVEVAGTFDLPTFRFVMASSQLEQRLDRPMLDKYVTSADDDALGSLGRAMARAMRGVAFYDYTRFRAGDTKVEFERLLLPLSDNGIDVTHILGVVTISEQSNISSHALGDLK